MRKQFASVYNLAVKSKAKAILNASEVDARRFFYYINFVIVLIGLVQIQSSAVTKFLEQQTTSLSKVNLFDFNNPFVLPILASMLAFTTLSSAAFAYSRSELAKRVGILNYLEEVGEKLYLTSFNLGFLLLLSIVIAFDNENLLPNHSRYDEIIHYINTLLKYIAVISSTVFTFSLLRKLMRVVFLLSEVASVRFIPDK